MSTCATYQTGMKNGMDNAPFSCAGKDLSVNMQWVSDPIAAHTAGEELVALIDGAGRLTCDGEEHVLEKGQGVLIPAGAERAWLFDVPTLLYRVAAK